MRRLAGISTSRPSSPTALRSTPIFAAKGIAAALLQHAETIARRARHLRPARRHQRPATRPPSAFFPSSVTSFAGEIGLCFREVPLLPLLRETLVLAALFASQGTIATSKTYPYGPLAPTLNQENACEVLSCELPSPLPRSPFTSRSPDSGRKPRRPQFPVRSRPGSHFHHSSSSAPAGAKVDWPALHGKVVSAGVLGHLVCSLRGRDSDPELAPGFGRSEQSRLPLRR